MNKSDIDDQIIRVYKEIDKITTLHGSAIINNLLPVLIENFELTYKMREKLDESLVKLEFITKSLDNFEKVYNVEKLSRRNAQEVKFFLSIHPELFLAYLYFINRKF